MELLWAVLIVVVCIAYDGFMEKKQIYENYCKNVKYVPDRWNRYDFM